MVQQYATHNVQLSYTVRLTIASRIMFNSVLEVSFSLFTHLQVTIPFLFFSLHEAPHYHPDANEHKGDAEPLTHVEGHISLEAHLHVLQKLDANARAENNDKESAEHQAGLLVAKIALIVHPQQDAHGHEAEETLIKTRRMAR